MVSSSLAAAGTFFLPNTNAANANQLVLTGWVQTSTAELNLGLRIIGLNFRGQLREQLVRLGITSAILRNTLQSLLVIPEVGGHRNMLVIRRSENVISDR